MTQSSAAPALNESPADAILRCEGLTKVYPDGETRALDGVDLTIRRGEFVAIMGPSGSGKTTLLNLIGLLDDPSGGEIYFDGQPISQIRHTDRVRAQKIGFVFQSFHLLPMLSAIENVQTPMLEGKLSSRERTRKAAELLQSVGMETFADRLPLRLSVGQRQRVAIARALANEPMLLLADEPTGNLDTKTGEEIMELFLRLHREKQMTVVLITHDAEVARRAGRLIRIRDGRIESDQQQ
ncbi:MAG TPA: ABC transporter ATP-binding protein [Pirellulales bacterium]|jgi:putative ABC transport system ATP-binding protein